MTTRGERYVVFDTETPNRKNDRMSAIGICVLENGCITQNYYTCINPECYFDPFNSALTGITAESVANAPTFPEVWQMIAPVFSESILIAHNAPFDMSVLAKCLRDYRISWKRQKQYICTCQMSRRCFPQLPNHKLNTICEHLQISLDHHCADSDAKACGEIFLRCTKLGVSPRDFLRTYIFRENYAYAEN